MTITNQPSFFQTESASNESASLEYKQLVEFVALHIRRQGITVTQWSQNKESRFLQLERSAQTSLIQSLQAYVSLIESVRNDKEPLLTFDREERQLLWTCIRKLGLRPTHDLLDRISDEDIVEIYDTNFVQIFRNMRFLSMCSYSLDEIFTYSFPELYRRPDEITHSLVSVAQKVISGEITKTTKFETPDHVLEEVFSREKRRFLMKMGVISPLFDENNQVRAFVATLHAEHLSNA